VPGELCLGGLIVDPFEEAVGQASPGMTEPGRLHHTGQRARWGPDGQLQLLGRLDDRVVIGGYRVEPAEVESRLAEHPAVAYAAVTVHPDPDGTPNLTAHLVLRQHPDGPTTAGPEPEQLRADLAELLPAYLLPTRIVLVDRLTLRPDGRLDRAALQATP
jgi:acyl-CoA synthetase (AMP-forming)/AMP-acid ligase II